MCMPRTHINYMIQATFMAAGLQGLLFFKIPDMWGNKKTMLVFHTVNLLAQFVILLVPNYHVRILAFFILGLTMVKNS